ncbi:HNH endonuclease family protein [Arsenicicoccus dermatophilus]|uniref:HNH endonuclease family protein n=1 Tax=Arsenicicoccus dermatophilus TaxID=1076331 RepID=UPI003916E92A
MRRTLAAVLTAGALIVPTTAPAAIAAQTGTVPATTAALQLKRGLPQTPAQAKADLRSLPVRPASPMTGYSREKFPHWKDASTWGWPKAPNDRCNSRNAALYRDGTGVKMSAACTNLTGSWVDPYSAKVFDAATDMDIDHLVPLANAWRSGAGRWTTTRRTQFANDPLVLVSAWDRLNQQKGDKGPEAWKPVNASAHCLYATRWVEVKKKYALSITSAEKTALTSMLATCR